MGVFQGKLFLTIKMWRSMYYQRKGYTLIELIVAICISFILIASAAYFFDFLSNNYKQNTEEIKQNFYVNEAFRFIEMKLRDNVRKVQVSDNIITLTKYNKTPPGKVTVAFGELDFTNSDISKISFNLVKIQHENLSTGRTDVLLKDVKSFAIEKKSGYLFITIEMIGGGTYEKCMDLRYIES
jgi:hypothetical protein